MWAHGLNARVSFLHLESGIKIKIEIKIELNLKLKLRKPNDARIANISDQSKTVFFKKNIYGHNPPNDQRTQQIGGHILVPHAEHHEPQVRNHLCPYVTSTPRTEMSSHQSRVMGAVIDASSMLHNAQHR